MVNQKELNEHLVLIICRAGASRDQLQKVMRMEGMQANFVSELGSVTELLAGLRPATLLHDWGAVDPSQSTGFQQRLGRSSDYTGLCRIIYTETITPQLTALAADSGVKRLVTYATTLTALIMEIKMALSGMKSLSEIQQLIAKTQATGVYDQQEIDKSIESAYALYAHDPAVKLEYGNLSLRRNNLNVAKEIANGLVAAQPQNVRAMNLIARVMMREGHTSEAIAMLEKANVLSPFNTDRLVMLGDTFFQSGDTAKAGAYYAEAMALDPNNTSAQKGQGKVKLSEGDINGALELLRNSASEEESVSFFNNAAVHAAKSGDHHKAHNLYLTALQAVRSDKYKPALYFNIAMTFERIGDLQEAHKNLKRSLKYDEAFEKSVRQVKRIERLLKSK